MDTSATADMQLRIKGVVTDCICRTTTTGHAQLEIKLAAPGQQLVRAIHTYPNKSPASHHAASHLARQLKGKQAELYATDPRFARQRLDCTAHHIAFEPSTPERKDIHS
ncbi:hypothetical protein [Comamonas suwonensis]|uniref:Uncharacterized protein n=1 Tax=Comamonas suwonensis TaxID=2606214 RepID=A0A843B1S1_9BURK|nr:hypothetical protein [Comamonas suwonensis]MBI1625386.1 hypothetical protein [Comamonas suwonensis]